jgi:hypothetical protein
MNLHYRVILAPVLAMGAILGMRRLKKYTVYPAVAVLAALAVSQYFLHLPLNMLAKPEYYRREARFNGAEALIKKIPPGASVIAQNNFVPHLSGRERIYPLVRWGKKFAPEDSPCAPKTECAWLGFAGVDYILVDFTAGQNPNNFWGADFEYTREAIENMVRTGWYNLEERRGEVELYRLATKFNGAAIGGHYRDEKSSSGVLLVINNLCSLAGGAFCSRSLERVFSAF